VVTAAAPALVVSVMVSVVVTVAALLLVGTYPALPEVLGL
jgi:hypothetical protein